MSRQQEALSGRLTPTSCQPRHRGEWLITGNWSPVNSWNKPKWDHLTPLTFDSLARTRRIGALRSHLPNSSPVRKFPASFTKTLTQDPKALDSSAQDILLLVPVYTVIRLRCFHHLRPFNYLKPVASSTIGTRQLPQMVAVSWPLVRLNQKAALNQTDTQKSPSL